MSTRLSIFPLTGAVLFPGLQLPLHIFEPRYLDMVSECLKSKKPFGVCLIKNGQEAGDVAEIYPVGTLASIIDFETNDDGILGITAAGGQRFKVLESEVSKNKLLRGEVELLDHVDDLILPVEYQLLSDMLRKILEKFELEYADQHERLNEPYWVGSRLAELLPLELNEKQELLEMDDPVKRLNYLQNLIASMEIKT